MKVPLVFFILVMKAMIPYNLSSTLHVKYGNDEWKSTYSLDQNDIPKMMLALSKAYEYLTLREDKQDEIAVEEL